MWLRSEPPRSEEQANAEDAIVATLRGGESLPAWNAVWDLVQSRDARGKQEVLAALKLYVDEAVADRAADQAREFGEAIQDALSAPNKNKRRILPSRELRAQHRKDQITAHRAAMERIGVRPGDGLPMWVMYMTRRSKRTWM